MPAPRDYALATATGNAVKPGTSSNPVSAADLLRTELGEIDPIGRIFRRGPAKPAACRRESPENPLLGFIGCDRGGKGIFVHATVLNRAGIADLAEGQRVAVDVVDGKKGPEAASLRLI